MPNLLQDLADVETVANEFPALKRATIRDWIYHAQERIGADGNPIPPNGFAPAVIRIGRRVYLDRRVLRALIEERRQEPLPESLAQQAAA